MYIDHLYNFKLNIFNKKKSHTAAAKGLHEYAYVYDMTGKYIHADRWRINQLIQKI